MYSIQQNIEQVTNQIRIAENKCCRIENSVQLLAVSKTKPNQAIEEAIAAGQLHFGENYPQEGVEKVRHFSQHDKASQLVWHFIGPIQSNKTRQIAEHFDWVHSIDRNKTAQRLNDQRPDTLPPLQVLIQVNTSGESSKSGINESEIFQLAELISSLPNLTLRGLMSIPANVSDYSSQLAAFSQLAKLKDRLAESYPNIDTLSMGMTGDMEAAIKAGSTIVRIGTAIFGARDYSKKS
ncbi:YggS family pyridoxal phosphate enzyme [Vibrio sp. MACH09]|uniref:YggS family pyridoxal phosphate-dependent enzyme n=1 Tax=unclassified Vibrio TaxID=2614977 RepID=UPI001493B76A|nr:MULTISPECIES: YggS family pyridoxal phosphate-dependent enzyme [unclassified Vibrio]NOI68701.1 YggS family pyridoxal phosphate-dependent enzyme [Vibrio sp. 99-8-1]GLO59869.1 YggS family pyridoxal phosphate enzyme [Vibrio sp. MACH09]